MLIKYNNGYFNFKYVCKIISSCNFKSSTIVLLVAHLLNKENYHSISKISLDFKLVKLTLESKLRIVHFLISHIVITLFTFMYAMMRFIIKQGGMIF